MDDTAECSSCQKISSSRDFPRPLFIFRGHDGVVTALHFTNEIDDGIREKPSLISSSDSGEIFIWSLETERTYHRIKAHNGKMILYLYYYQSSLISQARDGNIFVRKFMKDKDEWDIISSFNSSSYGFCSSSLFFTESKTYLVAPTGDQSSITFFDYDSSAVLKCYEHEETKSKLESGEMCMCMKVILKDAKIFVLMGYDSGFLSLWSYELNKEISRLKCHPEVLLCLDYDLKYRNRGISGSVDNTLQTWKVDANDELVKLKEVLITVVSNGINAVKIRQDGKIVVTAGQDGFIRIFSWKSLTALAAVLQKEPVFSLDYCSEPFGKHSLVATGSKDNNIYIITSMY